MCFCLLLMPKFYFSCRTICFLKANLIIMAGMKKYLIPLSIAAVLSGCQSIKSLPHGYVPKLRPQQNNIRFIESQGVDALDGPAAAEDFGRRYAAVAATGAIPVVSEAVQAALNRQRARDQAALSAATKARYVNDMYAAMNDPNPRTRSHALSKANYVPTLTEIPVSPVNTVKMEAPAKGFHLAPSHWMDVAKISDEATRLSYQVSIGKMTKVQAAQYLNNFRKRLVGRNAVDDSMYEIYLRSAIDSQRGEINTEQSKLYIQNALRGWQQRWENMDAKPNNPAFTNFLLEVMKMQPLK